MTALKLKSTPPKLEPIIQYKNWNAKDVDWEHLVRNDFELESEEEETEDEDEDEDEE